MPNDVLACRQGSEMATSTTCILSNGEKSGVWRDVWCAAHPTGFHACNRDSRAAALCPRTQSSEAGFLEQL